LIAPLLITGCSNWLIDGQFQNRYADETETSHLPMISREPSPYDEAKPDDDRL
jgi:hypothetical protein